MRFLTRWAEAHGFMSEAHPAFVDWHRLRDAGLEGTSLARVEGQRGRETSLRRCLNASAPQGRRRASTPGRWAHTFGG